MVRCQLDEPGSDAECVVRLLGSDFSGRPREAWFCVRSRRQAVQEPAASERSGSCRRKRGRSKCHGPCLMQSSGSKSCALSSPLPIPESRTIGRSTDDGFQHVGEQKLQVNEQPKEDRSDRQPLKVAPRHQSPNFGAVGHETARARVSGYDRVDQGRVGAYKVRRAIQRLHDLADCGGTA